MSMCCHPRRLVLTAIAIVVANASVLYAATATLMWDPNADTSIAGYRLSYGTQSGVYTTVVDVGNVSSKAVTVTSGVRYYFVVQAYTTSGVISGYSNEAIFDAAAPTITWLSPLSGPAGTAVTVTGANFGTSQGSSSITFDGVAAMPTSWSATSLVAPVPSGARSGNVVVTVAGIASNGAAFTVTARPSISDLSPKNGRTGASVTITGTNFGATKGASTVTFNGVTASTTSWSATEIVATVPSTATTGKVVVTGTGLASNGVTFTVKKGSNP